MTLLKEKGKGKGGGKAKEISMKNIGVKVLNKTKPRPVASTAPHPITRDYGGWWELLGEVT